MHVVWPNANMLPSPTLTLALHAAGLKGSTALSQAIITGARTQKARPCSCLLCCQAAGAPRNVRAGSHVETQQH